ncbi:MAG: hypothetical protein DSY90_08970 [Deltaproteobacteria bacterium]|nr:MAG: hypothetical protein DSY90_08970 [Deltaproteobacteria bacterium]
MAMMKKKTVQFKFRFGSAAILLIFSIVVSLVAYLYLKAMVTRDVYKETEIFISTADATRTYVKDILRPKMVDILPRDGFIPHAMSTSFIGREVMQRVRERFPEFNYKRASVNPMNPLNQADGFEKKMLKWFQEHPEADEWHGVIKTNDRSYYTRLRAIYAEAECLRCHGDPAVAPIDLIKIYGTKGGFHYSIGDVVAADTIYIPVDISFVRVREAAFSIFIIAVVSLVSLLGLFYLLFNRTVVSELKDLLATFRSISGKDDSQDEILFLEVGDEVAQLKEAFEHVAGDLKRAHDGLKTSEAKYRHIFETSQDAIIILDCKTRIKDINLAGLKLFGLMGREEALSIETAYQLFWDVRDARHFFNTVEKEGYVNGLERPMVDRTGKKLMVMLSATVRRDDNDQFTGIDVILRDVTDKRRMEKYLSQTEKLAAIGQLASGVAHEINNPLGVIKCYSNLIAKELSEKTQMIDDIRIIRKHTEQCQSVVDALLNFSRISEPKRIPTDIHTCIDDVLAVILPQLDKDRIFVDKDYSDDIPEITVDPQKIKQVLMNLFMNARQAMVSGGTLTVRTRLHDHGNTVSVAVADTGAGIAEKHIGRIFEPFFTTKGSQKGTGLGLSVSYGIIKQHGGEIEVTSDLGKGSTFTVFLSITGEST